MTDQPATLPATDQQQLARRVAQTPNELVALAIERGIAADELNKLLDFAKECSRIEGERLFGEALSTFQAKCPLIFKRREADRYKFASYDDIWREVQPIAQDCGLSFSFSQPKAQDGWYTIIVHIRRGAYGVDREYTFPVKDLSNVMQEIANRQKITLAQAVGFWLSYQKRFAFCGAGNIVVAHEDNDGAGQEPGLSGEQINEINELLEECRALGKPVNFDKFLAWLGVEELQHVRQSDFVKAIRELNRKRKAEAK